MAVTRTMVTPKHALSQGSCRVLSKANLLRRCWCKAANFHQDRMKATTLVAPMPHLSVDIINASTDEELESIAMLRACSFYVVPAERSFAGQRYQEMKAAEETVKLQEYRDSELNGREKRISIAAIIHTEQLDIEAMDIPQHLMLPGTRQVVVGTLDVVVAAAVEGQFLRGHDRDAAYMINVCVADIARRRGVGKQLVQAALTAAASLGSKTLYVHLMAVNEVGRALYESMGFTLEQEETSNQAHYRGQCLDGIEGRGRTILMKLSV
eukprot:jgi/Ulvmu1/5122/UM021_0139.1